MNTEPLPLFPDDFDETGSYLEPEPNPERDIALEVLETFERRDGEWLERIRACARVIADRKGRVCADDIRELMAEHPELEPPEGTSMNVMGTLFRRGFVRMGWKISTTPGSHGNRIGVYAPAYRIRSMR